MIVTFISQCEKNALKKTRRVLDAFANRIGNNTWQTIITEDGLLPVQNMLRQTASKSTAVSCHWIRTRARTQLLWIVGNKRKFNQQGIVAVNWTEKDLMNNQLENDWKYLTLIQSITSMAALLHDWGKASELFQDKINPAIKTKYKGDPIRHEWISLLLFSKLVKSSAATKELATDVSWLEVLSNLSNSHSSGLHISENETPFDGLPKLATMIAYLIVSHHRLPLPNNEIDCRALRTKKNSDFAQLCRRINQSWSYENMNDEYEELVNKCYSFSKGLMFEQKQWVRQLAQRANLLIEQLPAFNECIENGSWQLILHHSRLSLMLGDHKYSSLPANASWESGSALYANSDRNTNQLKQKLDEHLVGVANYANKVVRLLPEIESNLAKVDVQKALQPKPNTPEQFKWQDKSAKALQHFHHSIERTSEGYFIVNMASTGRGKTLANAKFMQALSEDSQSLRYILALGLRSLTLQTGDEYRSRLMLGKQDIAVLVGSSSVRELHSIESSNSSSDEQSEIFGSESESPLLDEMDYVEWEGELSDNELATVLATQKDRQLLYAPLLVCTIDHIMAATETKRGGRYILPALRLLSSDLVIDEIDDFSGDDLIAIGRLVHLCGMLGRKVMISSATIPPSLAQGYFYAYQKGWALFAASRGREYSVNVAFIDEFSCPIENISRSEIGIKKFISLQDSFLKNRVKKLDKQVVKRKGKIHHLPDALARNKQSYFENVVDACLSLHKDNNIEYQSKLISFGVVRVANISICVELTRYILNCCLPSETDIRCMAYHSQQTLLLRQVQESHLDAVLKRKEGVGEPPTSFAQSTIADHIEKSEKPNLIFILVATPVEEVGRDHDFDWSVIEPSSFRSIVQMAGRVRRHRHEAVSQPNIALMQYNWLGFEGKEGKVFCRPGYEVNDDTTLSDHDLTKIIDESLITQKIDATPRIEIVQELKHKTNLLHLEHYSIGKTLGIDKLNIFGQIVTTAERPVRGRSRASSDNWSSNLVGHINNFWLLTGLPQHFKSFRTGQANALIYLRYQDGDLVFCDALDKSQLIPIEGLHQIQHIDLNEHEQRRLWLKRDYVSELKNEKLKHNSTTLNSIKFGEVSFIPSSSNGRRLFYNDQLGLYRESKA